MVCFSYLNFRKLVFELCISFEPSDYQIQIQEERLTYHTICFLKKERKKIHKFREISTSFWTGQAISTTAEGEEECHKDHGNVLPKHPPEGDETTGKLSGSQQYPRKVTGHMVQIFVLWLCHMYKKFQQSRQHYNTTHTFCHTEIWIQTGHPQR